MRCPPPVPTGDEPGGVRDRRYGTTGTAEVPPQSPGAAAVARPEAAAGRTLPQTGKRVVNPNTKSDGERGGAGHPEGGLPGLGLVSQLGGRTGRPRGGGAPNTEWVGWRTYHSHTTELIFPRRRGGGPLHGGGRGHAGIYRCHGTPVIAGGLKIFPSSKLRDAPDRGSPGRCRMADLFASAICVIS